MEPALLQGIGAFLGGVASMLVVIAGVINRVKISAFLTDRFLLVESANTAQKRADAAERLALDYARSVEAMRVTVESIERRLQRLEVIEKKFETLVDWVSRVLEYIVYLEKRALVAGADLTGRVMPPMPTSLADHIELPEDLR